MVVRSAGEMQFTRVESDRARILVPPLAGAVRLSSLSDQLRSDNTRRGRRADHGSSNSLRMLLESAGEGIYGIDADGRCTFMNTAGAGALQVDVTQVMGELTQPLFHHTRADGSPIAAGGQSDHQGAARRRELACRDRGDVAQRRHARSRSSTPRFPIVDDGSGDR